MNLSNKPVGQELMAVPTRSTGPSSVEPESPILMEIEQTLEAIAESTRQAIDEMPVGKFDLTIIVPVYNERDTLPRVLDR